MPRQLLAKNGSRSGYPIYRPGRNHSIIHPIISYIVSAAQVRKTMAHPDKLACASNRIALLFLKILL